jgi:hypothetical protein
VVDVIEVQVLKIACSVPFLQANVLTPWLTPRASNFVALAIATGDKKPQQANKIVRKT